jgi:hypothetical protein
MIKVKSTSANNIIELNSSQEIILKVKNLINDIEISAETIYSLYLNQENNSDITFNQVVKTISEIKSIFLPAYKQKEKESCSVCGISNEYEELQLCEYTKDYTCECCNERFLNGDHLDTAISDVSVCIDVNTNYVDDENIFDLEVV